MRATQCHTNINSTAPHSRASSRSICMPVAPFLTATRPASVIWTMFARGWHKRSALQEALTVFADDLLSPVYVGWVQGYLDDERAKFETFVAEYNASAQHPVTISHPREALLALVRAFDTSDNATTWLA